MPLPEARDRYQVPDLVPPSARVVFVAESPHTQEVTPEALEDRRPLCGAAGKQWWAMLGEILEGKPLEDLSRASLLSFCTRHRIAVLNAVQWPLDPAVTKFFPQADPSLTLGFSKAPGEGSFRKLRQAESVLGAIAQLRSRLEAPQFEGLPVYALGNDAEWFVLRALGSGLAGRRLAGRIPHPSAWWRAGGEFRRNARQRLSEIFRDS